MRIDWKASWGATKKLCFFAGAIGLGSWFATERQALLLVPALLLVAALWYGFYQLERVRAARRMRRHDSVLESIREHKRGVRADEPSRVRRSRESGRAPDFDLTTPRKAWILLEDGLPAAIETSRTRAERWHGLGERFDYLPASIDGHGRVQTSAKS